jgi:disulfide bond formation protein DsbB
LAGSWCFAIYDGMAVTTRTFAGFVLVVSAAVLGAALLSQYWGGLMPCELCLRQRWPWAAAITIAIVVLLVGDRAALPWVALVFGIVFAVGASFAFYHVGVEQHWFAGPSACTASGTGHAKTVEEMKRLIMNSAPVQCDEVQWSLFGVSMAGWNLVASLAMVASCIAAALRPRLGARLRAGAA